VTFSPQIFSPHLGPNVTVFEVNFLVYYYSALFKNVFHINVAGVILLSQGLKMVEIITNISCNYWVMITNVTESREKDENALLKIFF
jgi:hypothetical protein